MILLLQAYFEAVCEAQLVTVDAIPLLLPPPIGLTHNSPPPGLLRGRP